MLFPFVQEIHNLQFTEEPDYHKLQFMLLKCLLDDDNVISEEYDWSILKDNDIKSIISSQVGSNSPNTGGNSRKKSNDNQNFNLDEFNLNDQGIQKSESYRFMVNNNFDTMIKNKPSKGNQESKNSVGFKT